MLSAYSLFNIGFICFYLESLRRRRRRGREGGWREGSQRRIGRRRWQPILSSTNSGRRGRNSHRS